MSVYSNNNSNITSVIPEESKISLLATSSHNEIDTQSEQSEADILSGVYPLRDTASEGSFEEDYEHRCNEMLQDCFDAVIDDHESDLNAETEHIRADMVPHMNNNRNKMKAELEEKDKVADQTSSNKAKHGNSDVNKEKVQFLASMLY